MIIMYISDFKLLFMVFHLLKFCPKFTCADDKFKIEYEWRQIEFDFASSEERAEAIRNGSFKAGFVLPNDVDVYFASDTSKKAFITCPRFYGNGVPATLGTITNRTWNNNPIVAAYPTWEWQTDPEKCKTDRIVSVYRVFIDDCDRIWVVDDGKVGDIQVCPPQILAFNLKTDSLVSRYEIPFDQHLNTSSFITPIAETLGCEETFVYIADVDGYSLLVYDDKNKKSWRIVDRTFYPYPTYGLYNINGFKFNFMDGIFTLALSPAKEKSDRIMFYHAMSSPTENWVLTKYLRNESLMINSSDISQYFHIFESTRDDQSAVEAIDSNGNMFFSLLFEMKIAVWNIADPYQKSNFYIVGDNKKIFHFPSGMKVINNKQDGEFLWILNNDFQKFATNSINPNEINFRILCANIKDLLAEKN